MKQLSKILFGVSLESVSGNMDVVIKNIRFDSRQVGENDVFVAVKGTQVDGHNFIPTVIEKRPGAIVCERLPEELTEGITYVQVRDSSFALGVMATNFFGNPTKDLKLIGVTGTNGKTSIATLLHSLFRSAGYSCGLISTIGNKINDDDFKATHTTPDAISLNNLLAEMVTKGCRYCFMEVSSHAMVQARTAGLEFSGAVFTNITHDHLDYHKTFDEYIKAKKMLFDNLSKEAFALVNIDDKRGKVMLQNSKASKHFYALKSAAEFRSKIIANSLEGLELEIDGHQVFFRIFGSFNAYNLLAVYSVAVLLGLDEMEVLTLMSSLGTVPGRLEIVPNGAGLTALVDYAHTPDALNKVLDTITEFRSGNEQLITVVGCGGDRDKKKRPKMAEAACHYSDKVILTSDNPRSEDPEKILDEMMTGVSASNRRKALRITNREEAIKTACLMAHEKDIILVAGKGHENYQEIKGERFPFDDREVLSRMLALNTN